MTILLFLLGILVVLGLWSSQIYNRLVSLSNRYENAFAQIEVQLKRRYDLIPNLVETVKGYMQHERETLEAVIQARNQAVSSLKNAAANPGDRGSMGALQGAEHQLNGVLGRLFALAESYPDIKANTNMQQLSEELTSTENKVAFSRQAFNDAVTAFNTYRQSFPPILFAGLFGFGSDASLLEFESTEIAEPPKVSF